MVIISNFLDDWLEKTVRVHYSRTKRIYNDYWLIWIKTGVLDYLCKVMKKRYEIPTLDIETDLVFYEAMVNDFDTVSMEERLFFDHWSRKEEFSNELYGYVKNLRLPRQAFDSLFDQIFYGIKLKPKEEWSGVNFNAVHDFFGLAEPNHSFEHTYTKSELSHLRKEIIELIKKRKIKMTPEIKEGLSKHLNKLMRRKRVIQDPKLYIETIEEMKRYHKRLWVDYMDDKDISGKTGNKQISEKCAVRIATKLNLENFTGSAFRRLVGRLYKEHPILRQFILAQKPQT